MIRVVAQGLAEPAGGSVAAICACSIDEARARPRAGRTPGQLLQAVLTSHAVASSKGASAAAAAAAAGCTEGARAHKVATLPYH